MQKMTQRNSLKQVKGFSIWFINQPNIAEKEKKNF